jgi:cytoskeletal protein CcmA (bactofilin family)
MGTKHVVPRAEGQGGIGTATLGWGELFITNTTNDSATQGGKLTLTSNDGAAMQSGSRLGVIEFKGAESDSALTIGARIEAICDAAWTTSENGASLKFYTTDDNASESLVLTLDSNKLAVFTGAVAINGNLTVNGTQTTVNSQTVTIDDPVFTLGGDTDHTSDDNKDRGIEFRYYSGSAKLGFFGWDDSASAFTFIADASLDSSEVFSGSAGDVIFGNITGILQTAAQTNITSVGALNGGTITSGFGAINNGDSAITTTGLISGGSLDIDNVLINGTTIGHTDDTDLMTLANGVLTVAGELDAVSLNISGNADIDGTLETDALSINGTAVTASAADINLIDGITNGTVIASKAIITDSNKDITGGRNITISGELDAATLDISGNADIDGTLEANAITVNGTALNTVIAGVTVTNATNAATVTGAAQGNITSLGTLTGLSVSGSVNGNFVSTIRNTFSTNSLSFGLQIRAGTNGSDHALRVVNHNESSLLLNVNGNGNLTVGGALSGTSASFSGNVTATGGYYYGQTTNSFVRLDNAIGSQIGFNNYAYSLYDSNGVSFYTAANATPTLKLNISTGGDVTLKGNGTTSALIFDQTSYARIINKVNQTLYVDSDVHEFRTSGGVGKLTISSGGAATFSGSVTAGGNITTSLSQASTTNLSVTNTSTSNGGAAQISAINGGASQVDMVAFGSGSTGTLYGITKAKLKVIRDNSLTAQSNGLAIGTDAAVPLYMFTNSVERVRITSGGNVGIGNNNPAVPLDITSNSAANALRIRARTQNDYGFMSFYNNAGTAYWGEIYYAGSATAGSSLNFTVGSGVPKLTISSGGGAIISGADNTAASLQLTNTASSSTWMINTMYDSGDLRFLNGSVDAMRISSGGAVSILSGLNPDLDVKGTVIIRGNSSAYTTHYLTTAAANVAQYNMYDASGNIKNSFSAGGNSFITGGDVGIGIASPTSTLHVVGTVNVTSTKNFYIDHPLESKKDTHSLIHASVESPEVNNLYRGKVDLVNGNATVNLDTVSSMTEGTFVALNNNAQCFTTNESDWDAVKGSVDGNELTISCQNSSSTANVSWMVISNRKDIAIMESSGTDSNGNLIVEEVKVQDP